MGKSKDDGGAATSNNVYIMDKKYAWVPARMVENQGDKAIVSVPIYDDEAKILSDGGKGAKSWKEDKVSLKHYPGKALPLQNVDKSGMLTMVPDMVDLPYLHEAAILYNLKARHVLAKPYTRTGDIIIAVNPYQWLTHLYTEKEQMDYARKLVWECGDMDRRKEVEPHVYETSALCYKGLAVEDVSQSILVSGESGAGKTETVKICMNHMASLQKNPNEKSGENLVVKRVVDSNPLLEIFGNAKTRRNDNSSRFGKYIMLQFHRKEKAGQAMAYCALAGSKCNVYLLEKSRITTHDESERTYHVFYALVGAKDEDKVKIWPGLKGTKNTSFKYVGHTDTTSWDKKSDGDHFYSTRDGLANVGVGGEKFTTLMRAIAAVLQIGQLNFGQVGGDEEKSECTSTKELEGLSEVIGIAPKDLGLAITERTMKTRGEVFKVPLKPDAAKDNADAFAREIYSKVFLWLVREINAATCAEENYEGGASVDYKTIGLLDIFGFESFPVNGFEQLCINYANEKLQQKFTRDIFSTVQDEYKFEGIALDDITYDDNSDVLDLIEGRTGLLAMLNEECVRPKGSDKEFVYKAINQNKKSPCLIADRLLGPLDFGIHHYAGKVVYFAEGFLARNQDSIAEDLIQIAKTSSNDIIANHLQNEKMMHNETEMVRVAPRRGKSNIASETLWNKFKSQLNSLMKSLNETQSRYIRCVKPNTIKKPLILMHMTSIEQLRCAGVVAAVTISRSAFPNRLDHRTCYERFKVLKQKKGSKAKGDKIDHKEEIVKILDVALEKLAEDGKKAYVVGKSRVYFRLGALEYLEAERSKGFDVWVVDIQKVVRGFLDRQRLKNKPKPVAAATADANENSTPAKTANSADDLNAILIQCAFRCYMARKEAKRHKKDKKGKKKKQKKQNKAAARIQAIARGWLTKRKVADLLKQKREKDALTNKIKELESKVKDAEKQREKEVEAARELAEAEMAEYRKKVKEEMANDKEKKKKNAQQQSLIEESGKIIEYLRKENMKLRNQNDTMRKDFKSLKENNQRLMEANASAGQSFTALNDHAKQLNATNAKLIKNVESYKGQLEKLKDDLKTRQTYYLAEAEARLAYQKTMAQIVGAVQEKCRDAQLVEDVVIMALECEAEAKSERAALEAAAKKSKAAASSKSSSKQKSKPKKSSSSSAPSVAKTDVSGDSDSDSSDSDSD